MTALTALISSGDGAFKSMDDEEDDEEDDAEDEDDAEEGAETDDDCAALGRVDASDSGVDFWCRVLLTTPYSPTAEPGPVRMMSGRRVSLNHRANELGESRSDPFLSLCSSQYRLHAICTSTSSRSHCVFGCDPRADVMKTPSDLRNLGQSE